MNKIVDKIILLYSLIINILAMVFKSINPKNGKIMKTFDCISNSDLHDRMERSFKVFKYMRNEGPQGLESRVKSFDNVKQLLQSRKYTLAEIITNEVGKPLRESIGEIDKSIQMIDYFNKNTKSFMEEESIPSAYPQTLVVQQPWGPTLSKHTNIFTDFRHLTLELPCVAHFQNRSPSPHGWKSRTPKALTKCSSVCPSTR